jgi:hypothetical protein
MYWLIGVPVYTLGLLLTTFFRGPSNPLSYVIFSQIVTGIGGGMFHVPVQLGIQAVTRHQEVAVATAMFLTFTSLGGSVGSAVAGNIWTSILPDRLERYLPDMDEAERRKIFNDFRYAMSFPAGNVERDGIVLAYVDVMRRLSVTATVAALPMMVLVFLMREVRLDRSQQNSVNEREESPARGSLLRRSSGRPVPDRQ